MWMELLDIKSNQVSVLLALIKARQEKLKKKIGEGDNEENMLAYVDTLFDVELPDTGRKLSDEELVSLCSEFLIGGTDTSATTLLWVMANLVKHQDIQEKLFDEINGVVKVDEDINEENMKKMPYLKAVVLETMRRHPPGHFILPRAVTEDAVMNGYDIPKDAMVNFTVAEIGWDSQVWEDPMEFKPERFLSDHDQQKEFVFDLKGVKEVKMMPFGAGRRVCPAITMSLLHLEFFVANLVRGFKWALEDGCEVDMSEKQAFTIVMKNPIRPCLCPRIVS
ncbi:Cytochrome P450 family protein [Quillaja saponaria]|uniref:Cytochrome P450 family protein n=1 Tax=Quillaja saponaria TaxID=32244 RepID=A0AAD7L9P0_QUISA|nr:Cytochrome P450 family protein [Quillaja saponaria]